MSEPAASLAARPPRKPAAVALAVMLLACGMILSALVLLAQGAVAAEPASAVASNTAIVRQQSEPRAAATVRSGVAERGAFEGQILLGAESSAAEAALEARIANSSSGGGFIAGAEIHVALIDGPAARARRDVVMRTP